MIGINNGPTVLLPLTSVTTNATAVTRVSFARDTYDQANISVLVGSHTTTTAVITGIKISESDTDTSASNMTDIAALCASNTTSTSAVNALPAGSVQGLGGIAAEFQIDLRARKKNIGVSVYTAAHTAANGIGGIIQLSRGRQSADTTAQKSAVKNLVDTNLTGCMSLIAG